jgi:hypothetical protein
MLNAMLDPQSVQTYHSEYLSLIKFYMNTKRPSSFVRYYNIDINNSTYDPKLNATYDLYHVSDVKFNLYDFTPTYYLAPIINASSNTPDIGGQTFDATSSIVTFTINQPRIHDIVVFYDPVRSNEIFRVVNVRTPINALHSSPSIEWFELELEYAPIPDARILKMLNHFVYDLTDEKYITYSDYKLFIQKLNNLENILNQLVQFYDTYYDLYQSTALVPVEANEVLIHFKKSYNMKYKRILEKFPLPYGYLDIVNNQMYYPKVADLPYVMGNYTYHVYNLVTRQFEEYTWSITHTEPENNVDKIFLLSYQLLQLAFNWQV